MSVGGLGERAEGVREGGRERTVLVRRRRTWLMLRRNGGVGSGNP